MSEVTARRDDRGRVEVVGVDKDESSPLRRIELSLDGQTFRWLTPEDGLLDGRMERFSGAVMPAPGTAGNWVVVRAQDSAGNRGLYRAWLEAAEPAGR